VSYAYEAEMKALQEVEGTSIKVHHRPVNKECVILSIDSNIVMNYECEGIVVLIDGDEKPSTWSSPNSFEIRS
jgi:hypothetical protein